MMARTQRTRSARFTARPIRHALPFIVAAMLMAGCAEPDIPQGSTETLDAAPRQQVEVDQLGEALNQAVEQLIGAIAQIDTLLATPSTNRDALQTAAANALQLLVFADDAVFPSASTASERDAAGNDAFSVTLNAARAHGGDRGDMVMNALRDTLAGDLGGWERDPAGMRTTALEAYGPTVLATKDAVTALPADGMRAIGWLSFAVNQNSPDAIKDALVNAQAHLEIVTFGVSAANAT